MSLGHIKEIESLRRVMNIVNYKYNSIFEKLLYIIGVLMPCQILAFKFVPIFLIPLFFYYILKVFTYKRMRRNNYGFFFAFLLSFSLLVMAFGSLPDEWKEFAVYKTIMFLFILFIVFFYITPGEINCLIQGLARGLEINLFWAIIQIILFYTANIDINNVIFNQLLDIRDNASSYNTYLNQFAATGLNWHPAQLVPIIILAFFFSKNNIIKISALVVAVLSSNTTCIFAIIICFLFEAIRYLQELIKKYKISYRSILRTMIIVICFGIGVIFLKNSKLVSYIIFRSNNIWSRIISAYTRVGMNNSTNMHLSYYLNLPSVLKRNGVLAFLFGIGFDSSGYPYYELFGYYPTLKTWIVESDPINFLVGRGMIWTSFYYSLLFRIANKGMHITYRFWACVYALLFCGILYNNQFLWVEFLVFILLIAVNMKMNVFRLDKMKSIPISNEQLIVFH